MKNEDWQKRAEAVRLLLLDVDGVLTDGGILFDGEGREMKFFDAKDGHGIKMLQRGGVQVGILSGRRSQTVRRRARELGIQIVRQKVLDKVKGLEEILRKEKIPVEQICYVGDDLVDLPLFPLVGLAIAVADAVEDVKARAHYVTRLPGGQGAVREVCDLLLKAQGKWETVTQRYFAGFR